MYICYIKISNAIFVQIKGLIQVQEQNTQLKEALEKETSKPVSGSMGEMHEMLDFKKMFAETKAHAKVEIVLMLLLYFLYLNQVLVSSYFYNFFLVFQ